MYVRWKVLLGLGTAFWLLLCLTDFLPVKHMDQILAEREQRTDVDEKMTPKIDSSKKDEGSLEFIKVIFWNIVAFASTIGVCFILKSMSSRLNIISNHSLLLNHAGKLTLRKTSSSRIPIPVTSKTSSIDIRIDSGKECEDLKETECNKSCPNLSGNEKVKIDSNSTWSIKVMEKHCVKLREEMINLQATSIKEHANVTKRLETLTKEKRDLIKQYNGLSKENKSLKQQLNDMIDERTLLIKRLECATKEMKTATKNKRATIAKLDEAVANAETLKTNLEHINKDKVILEDKLLMIDVDYKRLKEEVELYRQKEMELEKRLKDEKNFDESLTITEHMFRKFDEEEFEDHNVITQTDESDYDVSKPDSDIKKVQEKLLSLEKSLENFKLRHESMNSNVNNTNSEEESCNFKQESDPNPTPTTIDSNSRATLEDQPSTNSICTEPDCPLEHRECYRAECFLKRKLEETDIASCGDEFSNLMRYKDYLILKKHLPKLKSSISDERLSVISERATSTGDESGDDWNESKRRIVSHSPAFKKFFRDIIEPKINQFKINIIDEES